MHPSLLIVELQSNVFSHLRLSDEKSSLAALARTCKAFSESALDELWFSQSSLKNFFRILPSDAWLDVADEIRSYRSRTKGTNIRISVAILRPILPQEWSRALSYSQRVRELVVDFETDSEAAQLAHFFNVHGQKPFPYLEVFGFSGGLRTFSHILTYLGPRLRSVTLSLEDWRGGQWDEIAPSAPNSMLEVQQVAAFLAPVRELKLYMDDDRRHLNPDREAILAILLAGPERVRMVGVDDYRKGTLASIVRIPTLEVLDISPSNHWPLNYPGSGWDFDGPRDMELAFDSTTPASPSLRKFYWDLQPEIGIECAAQLLECATAWCLQDIELYTFFGGEEYTRADMARLYTTLASRIEYTGLTRVVIGSSHRLNANERRGSGLFLAGEQTVPETHPDAYDIALVELLFCFRNLTSVTLSSGAGFLLSDADFTRLSLAWPHLTDLSIGSDGRKEVKPLASGATLCAFARNCKALESLAIPVDMSQPLPGMGMDETDHSKLHTLQFNASAICDPALVAAFIKSLFPELRTLTTSWFHHEYLVRVFTQQQEGWDSPEVQNAREWKTMWSEVISFVVGDGMPVEEMEIEWFDFTPAPAPEYVQYT
ncbi:hypothetical protein MKEN_00187200 [Mycena kentingensis (nom. inval.)]|nr:hypothetical protein MKEN_00187200 [Mycena kentingensis (nom. inval.)]